MKKELVYNRRMYCGFPVIVVVYFDEENNRYSMTPLSSMYTLGTMIVMGTALNNFYDCVLKTKEFTVNILPIDYIDDIENAAVAGKEINKFKNSNLTLEKTVVNNNTIAHLKEATLIYKCSLEEVFEIEKYDAFVNLVCNLDNVLVDESILVDGKINVEEYNPIIFIGTDYNLYYKKTSNKKVL